MQGKLIIHIGPPKTASTSLQYYFQSINNSLFFYSGIFQPRGKNINSLAQKVYNLSCSDLKHHMLDCISDLENKLAVNQIVLISEEMFLLHQDHVSIESKLSKLYSLTSRFNPIITFCVRNPADAIPSSYQEQFNVIPVDFQKNYQNFQKSIYTECYDYSKLITMLKRIGFNNINYYLFEKFIANKITLSEVLGCDFKFKDDTIVFNKENIGRTTKKGQRLLLKSTAFEKTMRKTMRAIKKTVPFINNTGLAASLINISNKKSELIFEPEPILPSIQQKYDDFIKNLE